MQLIYTAKKSFQEKNGRNILFLPFISFSLLILLSKQVFRKNLSQ